MTLLACISTLTTLIFAFLWDAANMRAHRAEQTIIDLYATIQDHKNHDDKHDQVQAG